MYQQQVNTLVGIVRAGVTNNKDAFEVSAPRADGTVTVRFRNAGSVPVGDCVSAFRGQLNARRLRFTQLDRQSFRLAVDQVG